MPFLDWKEELSVNVKMFDDQHKKLISLLNSIYDAMKKGEGKKVMGSVLDELVDYTKNHFSAEERTMTQFKFPGYEKHLKEHKDLTAQVLDFQAKYKNGAALISSELLQFLKDWLLNHIMKTDKEYGIYFENKGLKF